MIHSFIYPHPLGDEYVAAISIYGNGEFGLWGYDKNHLAKMNIERKSFTTDYMIENVHKVINLVHYNRQNPIMKDWYSLYEIVLKDMQEFERVGEW
jgi:hypothetical protein